eukprot:CAMPEP_0170783924 /NCGR_PEP_ID=MMETSP0733-20121128/15846_1 /TAXON_ID=186038 /ORGANISM="Fragilariopsis kerguelensis, Strain L26-C5" /LENGTH=163 /DNA_ID=CAMNT_0011128771 /DNA_START=81 /DNA_END=569 /DNA_ORIENTATION=+
MNTFNPYYLTIFALFIIIGGSIISAETVLNKSVSFQHLRSPHNRPIIATQQKKFEQQQQVIDDFRSYNRNNAITRILEENDNDNNDNAAYTQTDKENTDTDNDNAAYTQTDKENTGTDNDNAADTEPDKQDTSFAYDHSDGSSTIKFNDKEFVISDNSEEWQW